MSSIFKSFLNNDIVPTRTLLNEAIPLTGSILSGTYTDLNVKTFTHGMFSAIYDYPVLSSSANHIFDITVGYASGSTLSSSNSLLNVQKINIYNEMAQVLMGYDITGSILAFDQNGSTLSSGVKMNECIFLNFARLLTKDEIKKGSFSMSLGVFDGNPLGGGASVFQSVLSITDGGGQNNFRVNSPAGEFGILSASQAGAYSSSYSTQSPLTGNVGLIYYQAGVVVLTGSIFRSTTGSNGILRLDTIMDGANTNINGILTGSITGACNAVRQRIQNIFFNNTTELNSQIYFCRINNNDYNYSSNPTYVSGSRIVVKNNTLDAPVTYITQIGGYSADNELLWVAKLSEPLRKDPTQELNIRVRCDY